MSAFASPALLPFRQRAPLAGLFIAAVLGVLVSDQQPEWWPAWSGAFLVTALVVLIIRATVPALLLIFFAFAFWHGNQIATNLSYQRSRQKPFDAAEHTVTLLVLSEPTIDRLRSAQRFTALVSCIDNRPACFQTSAECSGESFSYGDRLLAQGKFHIPTHPMNPGEFDFGDYLRRQNIYLSFRAHHDVPAMIIARNQGNPLIAAALAGRRRLLGSLQAGLHDDMEVVQTMQGMVLGARADTSPGLKKLFRDTGTIHLFAASGLQVGLFTGFFWSGLRYVRLPRRSLALAIAPAAIAYCAITGFHPATVRATVMAIFIAIGASLERPVATVNSLCGSGLLILGHDTQELFQTGFQLSFVAVFAILTAARPLADLLYRPFQVDPFLPMRLLASWQRAWHQAMFRTCEILSLSTVCWAATAPILIYQEHRLSLVAIPANLLVVPMATAVMFLAVAGLLAGTISSSIAGCLNNTSWLLTNLILWLLHASTLFPWHSVNVSGSNPLQPDHVTALAEGSDHVIHLHVKGQDWLINTGRLSQWRSITEPYLQFRGVNRLDELVLWEAYPHVESILELVNSEFQVARIVGVPQAQARDPVSFFQVGQDRLSTKDDPVETLFADQPASGGKPVVAAILVRLEKFRVLILPMVTETSLMALKCDHADVVYCGRLGSRHFPRDLMVKKLSPSILVLNGTKPEIIANAADGPSTTKCLYVKQAGAITTELLNRELVVRGYRGSECRLRSLSR